MRVSVIMAAWNGERYIEAAVRSVLEQEPRVEELIVVDDGSTDGTPGVLRALAAGDSRMRVFRQENQGVAGASNAALRHVRGDVVVVADCDDIQLPGRIAASLAGLADEPGADIWSGSIESWDGSENAGVIHRLPTTDVEIRAGMLFESQMFHQSACYRAWILPADRTLYDRTFTMAGDYDLWSRLLGKARFRNGGAVTTRYRRHAGQTTSVAARDGRSLAERRRIWTRILGEWFGIVPGEAELELHEIAATWRPALRVDDAIRVSAWLHRIGQACDRLAPADRRAVRRDLARRHHWVASRAPWSGARALSHFFRAPLGWNLGVSFRSKAGFVARALRRRPAAA